MLASCRQGDDVVATLKGPDTGVPPIEDAEAPPPDISVEHDAPPVTMDSEVPRPDVMVEDIVVIPPPPVDAGMPPTTTCESTGPILSIRRVSGARSDACAGQLAAHTFTHALCTCEDLNLPALKTVSFNSATGDQTTLSSGAAVGVGGGYPSAATSIGGTLTVAGTSRTTGSAGLDVQGDLRLAGTATFYNQLWVKRDAWFVSRVQYWATVTILGNLNLAPPAGTLIGLGPEPVVGGSRIITNFTIDDDLCGCTDKLDIASIEPIGTVRYDNAAAGIDPTALSNVTTTTNMVLPCGRFRFDSIGGTGALQLTVTGRTAIFVDGNATLSDSFKLVIAGAEAEVDWFIRGNLSAGAAKLGDPKRPAATRIYVGGTNDILLSGGEVGANIYAPNANVNFAVTAIGLNGSIYGRSVTMVGGGFFRYDRNILDAGNKCPQPTSCDKCHSCNGGAACVNGVCGACTHDSDCCTPLVCAQGSCQPLLFP